MQQEAKRRAERQSFLLTTIPITVQAAHEPGLDHAPADEHAECKKYYSVITGCPIIK